MKELLKEISEETKHSFTDAWLEKNTLGDVTLCASRKISGEVIDEFSVITWEFFDNLREASEKYPFLRLRSGIPWYGKGE